MRREQKMFACFFPLIEFKTHAHARKLTTDSTNQPANQPSQKVHHRYNSLTFIAHARIHELKMKEKGYTTEKTL